jgi:hypothetical protein
MYMALHARARFMMPNDEARLDLIPRGVLRRRIAILLEIGEKMRGS